MDDHYFCSGDGPLTETKIKGSRFLAQALAARDEQVAMQHLEAIRRRDHDATHHCWAYRIGEPALLHERFDDDGEPSGSAGRPILGALHREDLSDTLVVVTRWFGGTKLGTGGLVRAYGEAAALALRDAPRIRRDLTHALEFHCSFDDLGLVEAVLHRASAALRDVSREFDPEPRLRLHVLRSHAGTLRAALVDATAGRIRVDGDDSEAGLG